ncbi:Alpha crystallin/Hsp20 domain [Trinorchestia longiramus]|nr:Alpha crystallin/Hsp20 domain [Trinorchestia longiramus]
MDDEILLDSNRTKFAISSLKRGRKSAHLSDDALGGDVTGWAVAPLQQHKYTCIRHLPALEVKRVSCLYVGVCVAELIKEVPIPTLAMAPGDHTAMLGSSLPNFVCLKDLNPDLCSNAKTSSCDGCVMFYPPPALKGPFMIDNVFHEVRQLSELQRIKCRKENSSHQRTQLELRNDLAEDAFEEMSEVIEQRHKFYIIVPVVGYSRDDILIKAVGDKEIIIESKPDALALEDQDSFHMMFMLPVAIRLCAVKATMSSDKILVITAPKMKRKL